MTVMKEAFVDLQEKYNKVMKLIFDDSKSDPETEPYLSKYSARQILIGMKANLENLILKREPDTPEYSKVTAMSAAVQLYLGVVSIDTEELSVGEKHLEKCLETIDKHEDKPEMIMIALYMYNQFGILWSQREPEKSKMYLEKSEQLYINYKKAYTTPPVDIEDLFNQTEKSQELVWKNFEKHYTLTLYYLAQIYGALKDALKSSVYCHTTLKRQLESEDYESIDWALNAATLSQFFMEKNGFKQARHHLAASSYILDKYKQALNQIEERNEVYEAKIENFRHRSADVARCWAKYGLLLLSKSKERLLNQTDDNNSNETNSNLTSDLSKLELTSDSTVSLEDLSHLYFHNLDLSTYENQITYQFILTIQDARLVFLNIQNWLDKSKLYYTLDSLASDHIEIIQDQSQMYLYLLFFEDNPENQAKLHKRRIDLLENIIKKINPQYYLQYCRQIWYELAQTYYDILNIKADKLRESNERPTPHALTKINLLVEKSINQFTNFIQSFKEASTGKIPDKIYDDFEKVFLQAYFHIAALNSRFITLDKTVQLNNVEKSLEAYTKVYEYCNLHKNVEQLVPLEYDICKEMVRLLPIKIAKLRQEIS